METNLGLAFLFLTVYAFFEPLNYLTGKQVAEETSACERKFLELLAQATNISPQSLKGILRRDLGLYSEEGFGLDGDARESLKAWKMLPSFLKCKNNYLFKMRKKFCGWIARMM